MNKSTITQRLPLPCTVPQGGLAVVLADGRVAREGVQGPGHLKPDDWCGQGKDLEAVVFPSSHLRLAFEVPELPTAEGVRLDLRVDLSLQIENPVQFLTDVVQDAAQLGEAELADLLRAPVHTALADGLRRRTLANLDADANLRAWLGTVIEGYLTTEADLLGRFGLAVLGVDAFDLRYRARDEQRQAQESFYLRATLAEAEAEGRRLLDQRLLSQLRAHLPVKEELVEHQRRMADLMEQQIEVEDRIGVRDKTPAPPKAGAEFAPKPGRRRWPLVLVGLGLAVCCVLMAGPVWFLRYVLWPPLTPTVLVQATATVEHPVPIWTSAPPTDTPTATSTCTATDTPEPSASTTPEATDTPEPTTTASTVPSATQSSQQTDVPAYPPGWFEVNLASYGTAWILTIQRVVVQPDDTYRFDVYVSNLGWYGVLFDPAQHMGEIYVGDNLGNRYDVIRTGGVFSTAATIGGAQTLSGWLVFPSFRSTGTDFFLYHPVVPPLNFGLGTDAFVPEPIAARAAIPGDRFTAAFTTYGAQWGLVAEEMVVQPDGTYRFDVYVSNLGWYGVLFDPSQFTGEIYVGDNLGNRYDVVRTGGVFSTAATIGGAQTLSGWLIFSSFEPMATQFFFYHPAVPPVEFTLTPME